ncbi:HEAT repeat domain-containing protein [Flagellimonas allohymeniacidonis]|nr:HEAT repeat domain-containing protein [Allomuricauda hymeniacidonis]
MDKEKFEMKLMDYLSGDISKEDRAIFEKLLSENEAYQKEYADLSKAWSHLEALDTPEPSPEMDETFFTMLSKEIGNEPRNTFWNSILEIFSQMWKPKLAYGILLLGIGLGVGYFLNPAESNFPNQEVVAAENEAEEVRQRLVLTLLEQPSANQRLQGVSEANKISKVDSIVVKALLQTLNGDPNVNVRLAAIESLTNYLENPLVRQGLVQSIAHQESPILQVTLANLMVALQEKASIEPFRQLLKEKTLDTTVKKKIENSIESII